MREPKTTCSIFSVCSLRFNATDVYSSYQVFDDIDFKVMCRKMVVEAYDKEYTIKPKYNASITLFISIKLFCGLTIFFGILPTFKLNIQNIPQNIVGPAEHYYGSE